MRRSVSAQPFTLFFSDHISQEVRHTYSAEKNNFLAYWVQHGSPLDTNKIKAEKILSPKTAKFLSRVVPGYAKPKGMHTYAHQPHIKEQIEKILDKMEKDREEGDTRDGLCPVTFSRWVESNKVKAKLWGALTKAERKSWTKRSQELPPDVDR
jgi:hypothetical protein